MNSDDATLVGAPSWTTGIVGGAVTLNGSSQYAATAKQVSNPTAFTLEIWFKSTSSTGGRLMGLGDAQTGASTNRDRQLYLNNSGQIIFGTHPSGYQTVTTASSYNDGSWHHVAASLGAGGLLLYVDGIRRGTDTGTTTAQNYNGYWRMGYDDLTGWPSAPTSNYLAASIDEARVYTRQLSDGEIDNDHTAGFNALHGAFTLPNITPGISQTYSADAVVRTDTGGYDLYIQAPTLLTHTDTTTTIPMISASIASPAAWSEGTTKGLGFSLTAFTGTDTKWGTNPNYDYAGIPNTATVYHSRTGLNGGIPELTTLQFRADTTPSQKQGTYSHDHHLYRHRAAMKKLLASLLLLTALLPAIPAEADVPGLQVNPLQYEDTLTSGSVRLGYIEVSNPSDTTITLESRVQGFRQKDNAGRLSFFDDPQISDGIKVDLAKFDLGSHEAIRVAFSVDPTKLPKGGVYAVIFFRTLPPCPIGQ